MNEAESFSYLLLLTSHFSDALSEGPNASRLLTPPSVQGQPQLIQRPVSANGRGSVMARVVRQSNLKQAKHAPSHPQQIQAIYRHIAFVSTCRSLRLPQIALWS